MTPRGAKQIELSVMIAIIIGFLLYAASVNNAEAASSTYRQARVLIIYSNERLLPANIAVDEAIRAISSAPEATRSWKRPANAAGPTSA